MGQYVNTNSNNAYKLVDYIKELEGATYSFDKGFLDPDLEIHIFDIFDNFFKDESNLTELYFDEHEKMVYRYNPKQLCRDLYGTHEFWQKILEINEIDHEGLFDLSTNIKVPKEDAFKSYIRIVYSFRKNEFGNSMQEFSNSL